MRTEIGRRLRELRVGKGLTQQGLAVLAGGLDYTYIGKIERGDQLPSLKILGKLGEALGVPVGHFFPGAGEPAGKPLATELRPLLAKSAGRELIDVLNRLHPDDVRLAVEILKLLHRHRAAATQESCPRAAEEESPYGEEG